MASAPKSRRSGGPRTELGKIISSGNSLRTGVYAQADLLPSEDPRQFNALEQLFVDDLRPVGVVEAQLVQTLVKATWKKLRLETIESRALANHLARIPGPRELEAAGLQAYPAAAEKYVASPSLIEDLDGQLIRRSIWSLAEFKQRGMREEALEELKINLPQAYQRLKIRLEQISGGKLSTLEMASTRYYFGASTTPIADTVDELMTAYEGELWATENQATLLEVKQAAEDRRLLEFYREGVMQRAFDDLERTHSRALKELRAQQNWRRAQGTISGEDRSPRAKK